jgi:hypothetical protein
MVNANYPVKLKAGEIFEVNLPNFLFVSSVSFLKPTVTLDFTFQIIKTSYSLCNVLRNLK